MASTIDPTVTGTPIRVDLTRYAIRRGLVEP